MNNEYKCKNAVLICMFNRPENVLKVFEQVKKVKPPRLYLVCDGIRNQKDIKKVNECRNISNLVDWSCKVINIFSDFNLGCKKRVITGITEAFKSEEKLIILEDDCIPTIEFFKYMDECLETYENNDEIAIISGSNLLDYKFVEQDKIGFSNYINCWGWGTWKSTWNLFDAFLSIQEVNQTFRTIMKNKNLSFFEKKYWLYIFRNAIYTRTIWDFYLQYFFFKYNWKSVYPAFNLVHNIGFAYDSTHMKKEPEYVVKSIPNAIKINLMLKNEMVKYDRKKINYKREKDIIRTLYGYSFFSYFKIKVGNILRYVGLRK